jgi:hypothetical protein
MKKNDIIYLATFSIFLFKGYSQESMRNDDGLAIQQSNMISQNYQDSDGEAETYIKYYHVVETINMKFGGSITSYNVSDKSLIRTNDLGPNNTRVITPKFGEKKIRTTKEKTTTESPKRSIVNKTVVERTADKPKKVENNRNFPQKQDPSSKERSYTVSTRSIKADRLFAVNEKIKKDKINNAENSLITDKNNNRNTPVRIPVVPQKNVAFTSNKNDKNARDNNTNSNKNAAQAQSKTVKVEKPTEESTNKDGYAYINIIKTYEKVAEKGYKSVVMFKKLGNNFYFNNDMGKAVRWYGELFAMEEKLDSEYYYRYATALKVVGQKEKSDNIMQKFNQLSKI